MDDLFFTATLADQFTRNQIFINGRTIAVYTRADEITKEAERIEISIIEAEDDLWLDLTNKD